MSKYEPLKRFLIDQTGHQAPMSFADVERALGARLPRSARQYAPWWANETDGGHVQARAWLEAGWKTSRVDVAGEKLVFVRGSGPESGAAGVREGGAAWAAPGAMKGQVVALDLTTLPLGAVRLIADYAREAGGDRAKAVARALHEAAIGRRGRLIDRIVADASRSFADSVDLVREDRDAR